MRFTGSEVNRILALKEQIEQNEDAFRSVTYRDAPALTKIVQILSAHSSTDDTDELRDKRAVYRFVAECYHVTPPKCGTCTRDAAMTAGI